MSTGKQYDKKPKRTKLVKKVENETSTQELSIPKGITLSTWKKKKEVQIDIGPRTKSLHNSLYFTHQSQAAKKSPNVITKADREARKNDHFKRDFSSDKPLKKAAAFITTPAVKVFHKLLDEQSDMAANVYLPPIVKI